MLGFKTTQSIKSLRTNLLSLSIILMSAITAAPSVSAKATEVSKFTSSAGSCNLEVALDGDKFYHCFVENFYPTPDVTYTIIDNEFKVIKSFTLKGILKASAVGTTDLSVAGRNLDDVYVTRGLFTNDNKWCVIIHDYSDEDNSKYIVYNEDGNALFELPTGREIDQGDVYYEPGMLFLSNVYSGTPCYVTIDQNYDNGNTTYTAWSFNGAPAAVSTITNENKLAIYPNPVPSGLQLTIELPQEADSHTVLTVSDMRGRQVYRRNIPQSESKFRLSPHFGNGLYIYTIIYSDGTSFTGKVAAE